MVKFRTSMFQHSEYQPSESRPFNTADLAEEWTFWPLIPLFVLTCILTYMSPFCVSYFMYLHQLFHSFFIPSDVVCLRSSLCMSFPRSFILYHCRSCKFYPFLSSPILVTFHSCVVISCISPLLLSSVFQYFSVRLWFLYPISHLFSPLVFDCY